METLLYVGVLIVGPDVAATTTPTIKFKLEPVQV
jgi:hypothetical protein